MSSPKLNICACVLAGTYNLYILPNQSATSMLLNPNLNGLLDSCADIKRHSDYALSNIPKSQKNQKPSHVRLA
mgnify:CR=1 FL=1